MRENSKTDMNTAPASLLPLLLLVLCANLQPIRTEVLVPKDGIYLLSVITDPSFGGTLEVTIYVNGYYWFKAYGRNDVKGGFDVALPLKAHDEITPEQNSKDAGQTHVNILFASDDQNGFKTVLTVSPHYNSQNLVGFQYYLGADQQFHFYRHGDQYQFTIPYSGIYWVMLRAECQPEKWANLGFANNLFKVYCQDDSPMSTSGAYFLTAGTKVSLEYLSGDSRLQTEATTFSFVHLKGNSAGRVGEGYPYMAYTAYANVCDNTLAFNRSVSTDYGDMYMYSSEGNSFTIRVTGTYVMSVRGASIDGSSLRFEVFRDAAFNYPVPPRSAAFYTMKGFVGGQTAFLDLTAGEVLYLTASDNRRVGEDTMVSIAFVW